jgi:probable F420-dependent oxidoreductase
VTTRPFRFGCGVSTAPSAGAWGAICREAEDLGFSSILMPDHFNDQFALVPALASAAALAPSLRVGALVACNDYRHPVMYAKELATIDLLSRGRVEWGMGAGWLTPEYEQAGIPFDPGPVRVSRLIEAVRLMKALFAGGPVTTDGPHYRLAGVTNFPAPVQHPHPPLAIGGSGRRLLRFAAREADIVGIGPSLMAHPGFAGEHRISALEAADRQTAWIREAAGNRYEQLELNMVAFPLDVTDDRAGRVATLAAQMGIPPEELVEAPHVLLGDVDELCEALETRRDRWGVSYWVIPAPQRHAFAPVIERLAGR